MAGAGGRDRRERAADLDLVRGIVMLLAAAIAFWKGWQIHLHHGHRELLAFALGVLALAMGVWHLTRRTEESRAARR